MSLKRHILSLIIALLPFLFLGLVVFSQSAFAGGQCELSEDALLLSPSQ